MNKKPYNAPKITRIKMVIQEAILGICHNSPGNTPAGWPRPCSMEQNCFEAGVHD
jgi:hypothetical protein